MTDEQKVKQAEVRLDVPTPLEDFQWPLTVGGETFTIVMNECADDTPWVGEVTIKDGSAVTWDKVIDAVMEAWLMGPYEADGWLHDALTSRLNFQRRQLGRLVPELSVVARYAANGLEEAKKG